MTVAFESAVYLGCELFVTRWGVVVTAPDGTETSFESMARARRWVRVWRRRNRAAA